MRTFEYTLLSAGNMSGNINSPLQRLNQMQIGALQASWSGSTPVGTLKLQISNDDPDVVGTSNVIWTDYTGSSTDVNGNGNFLWNLLSLGFNCVRVVYTRTSGSGSLKITIMGKGPA